MSRSIDSETAACTGVILPGSGDSVGRRTLLSKRRESVCDSPGVVRDSIIVLHMVRQLKLSHFTFQALDVVFRVARRGFCPCT